MRPIVASSKQIWLWGRPKDRLEAALLVNRNGALATRNGIVPSWQPTRSISQPNGANSDVR